MCTVFAAIVLKAVVHLFLFFGWGGGGTSQLNFDKFCLGQFYYLNKKSVNHGHWVSQLLFCMCHA